MKPQILRIPESSWKEDGSLPVGTLFAKAGERGAAGAIGVPASKSEDYYLVPQGQALTVARRMIVIVPPGEFNEQEFAWKLARIGRRGKYNLLLVGLASDPVRDSLLRRRMATLCSILRAPNIDIDYKLIFREDWLSALQEVVQDGDRLVCLEEHFTMGRLFRNEKLARQLVSSLGIPVYVARGVRLAPELQLHWTRLKDFLVWVSVLLTLALFFLVQVRIQQTIPGTMGTTAEILSVLFEVLIVVRIVSLSD